MNYFKEQERFNGDYTGDVCPECGRERIMLCQDGKRHCEKCYWCIEDQEYEGEWFIDNDLSMNEEKNKTQGGSY